MKILRLLACAATSMLLVSCATVPAPLAPERIAAIVASPERTAADRENDVRRKPADMLAFIGVRPGMAALDISAGRGYTTELIARAVGPAGKAIAQAPMPANGNPDPPPAFVERQKNPQLAHLQFVRRPFDDPVPTDVQGRLDLVTVMFNYHDLGNPRVSREKMNRAVFDGLKPGGMYVIADHAGRAGTGISEWSTVHRVEEAFVVREVEAAGFRLAARGEFLRNPQDPRDQESPPYPKDEFVLKFVKP
jgi:predicted methyltransferase